MYYKGCPFGGHQSPVFIIYYTINVLSNLISRLTLYVLQLIVFNAGALGEKSELEGETICTVLCMGCHLYQNQVNCPIYI